MNGPPVGVTKQGVCQKCESFWIYPAAAGHTKIRREKLLVRAPCRNELAGKGLNKMLGLLREEKLEYSKLQLFASSKKGKDRSTAAWITDLSEFLSLRTEWDDLLDQSSAGLFNSWEWLYPWYRHIAPHRALQILVLRNQEGLLIGLLPLSIEIQSSIFGQVRYLRFLGDSEVGSDYLDLVSRKGFELEVAQMAACTLQEDRPHPAWHVMEFVGLRQDALLRKALEANSQHWIQEERSAVCPYQVLDANDTFEAFMSRQGRSENYRRRRKWFEAQSGFKISKLKAPSEMTSGLDAFFELHALRWNPDGGSAAITSESLVSFHREAASYLAERQQICLTTLEISGKLIASTYLLQKGKCHMYYQSGMDPRWRPRSPGLILIAEAFKGCLEAGGLEFDFLRGEEPYKAEWVKSARQTITLTAYRNRGKGRMIYFKTQLNTSIRRTLKKIIPQLVIQKIRAVKKTLISFLKMPWQKIEVL